MVALSGSISPTLSERDQTLYDIGLFLGHPKAREAQEVLDDVNHGGFVVHNTGNVLIGIAHILPAVDSVLNTGLQREELTAQQVTDLVPAGLQLYDDLRLSPFRGLNLPQDPYHKFLEVRENAAGCAATLGILLYPTLTAILTCSSQDPMVMVYSTMLATLAGVGGYLAYRESGRLAERKTRETIVDITLKNPEKIWQLAGPIIEKFTPVMDFLKKFENPRQAFQDDLYQVFHPIERHLNHKYCKLYGKYSGDEVIISAKLRTTFALDLIRLINSAGNGFKFSTELNNEINESDGKPPSQPPELPFLNGMVSLFEQTTGRHLPILEENRYMGYLSSFSGGIYGGLVDLANANSKETRRVRQLRADRITRLWRRHPCSAPQGLDDTDRFGINLATIENQVSDLIGKLADWLPTSGAAVGQQTPKLRQNQ